jgi:N-acetylmuramoyl-L-alanine amidase
MPLKVYLCPSGQEHNIGVGDYGTEWQRCTEIARYAALYLRGRGFEVKLPRNEWATALSPNEWLARVVADSNAFDAQVHVPIHTNAGPKAADGTMVFYVAGSARGYKLAKNILARVSPVSPGSDYPLQVGTFYEMLHTNAPCAYVETIFHTNPAEAIDVVRASKLYGWAIAAGICDYFGVKAPVRPLASARYIKVPVPLRLDHPVVKVFWGLLQRYLARVKKTG